MNLLISKNKDGNGYYSKIQNDFNGIHTEKYLNLKLPKDTELEYGLYDVDGFLSTYAKKDGTVEFKFVITKYDKIEKESTEENEFKDSSIKTISQQQIEITDDDLPF